MKISHNNNNNMCGMYCDNAKKTTMVNHFVKNFVLLLVWPGHVLDRFCEIFPTLKP